jgi:hypothetical protein
MAIDEIRACFGTEPYFTSWVKSAKLRGNERDVSLNSDSEVAWEPEARKMLMYADQVRD